LRSRRIKAPLCAGVLVVLVTTMSGPALAFDSAIVRSLLLPGSGQAQNGNYTRAALFAGAAIVSGAGLFASQLQYNRALDGYNDARRVYLHYPETLETQTVPQSEIDATYDFMQKSFDDADARIVWRNAFLTALIATYAVNIVDVIVSEPNTGELGPASGMSVELRGRDVMLMKSFSF